LQARLQLQHFVLLGLLLQVVAVVVVAQAVVRMRAAAHKLAPVQCVVQAASAMWLDGMFYCKLQL
jgi:hypothetical protein